MFDLTPLYRSSVGFDRLNQLLGEAASLDVPNYPPYNIELIDQDNYKITMAVAGFEENEIEIELKENLLRVTGRKAPREADSKRQYLHQGIAERNFERRFQLADHVKVVGAEMENGLLHISLVREVPEAMKPRTIAINGGKGSKARQIEGKKAA